MFQMLLGFVGFVIVANALIGERGLMESTKARRQSSELARSIEELKRENARFRQEARRLRNDPLAIEQIARQELVLVSPGELLFIVKDLPPPSQRTR